MNEKIKKEIVELISLIGRNGRPGRLGKTFITDKNYYYYDTGTGKVAKLTQSTYLVLKYILEANDEDAILHLSLSDDEIENSIYEIRKAMKEENILQAPPVKTLTGEAVKNLDDILENGVENVTLEVTEKCNLRCRYCIYHPDHPEYREFGHRNMEWDTAKKAIDFLKAHSQKSEHRHIGFYGGEPLVNFELIKQAVQYAKEIFDNNITFALTTNATLVNTEIASFFADNDFNLIISLDGPEELHNANRIMVNGEGSFNQTIRGCKKIFQEYQKRGKQGKVGFNMVVSGPDYQKQYDEIQHFIECSEWIPKDTMILTATVDRGPSDSEYYIPQSEKDREFMETFYEPLFVWEQHYRANNTDSDMLFSDGAMDKGMLIIHKRLLTDKPIKEYGMNGCCVPGQRRIYVTVDGKFLHCEKVGNIPGLGDVQNGFDKKKIEKHYVKDFIKEAQKYCKECWAINLCTLCYVNCYDSQGTHFSYRHNSCRNERKYLEDNLIRYHMVMEKDPDSLAHYNDVTVQ